MINANVEQVIDDAERLIQELESQSWDEESLERDAINNLRTFVKQLRRSETKDDVIVAGRILARFSVGALEWGSELIKQVDALAASADRCARQMA